MDTNTTANNGSKPLKRSNHLPQSVRSNRVSRYNYTEMKTDMAAAKSDFIKNLTALRTIKGKSSREMSLSIGQGPSYINDIENGRTFPSMAMFFEICEYFEVSPAQFFSYTDENKTDYSKKLAELVDKLTDEDKRLVIEIIVRFINK